MINLSITGADNNVDINQLSQLAKENPNVEFGLIYLLERQTAKRNPDYKWRESYVEKMDRAQTSMHLCAAQAFNELLRDDFKTFENEYGFNVYQELSNVNRVQLNINSRHQIFTIEEIHKIYNRLLRNNFKIIVQYNENSKKWIDTYIEQNENEEFIKNIDILLDASLGRGIVATKFNIPENLKKYNFKYGIAGGVNIDNLAEIKKMAEKLNVSFWIDLETGARTKNEFDFEKVEKLIEGMK